MPIHTGQDKNGQFYQWGKTGKKYYFKPEDKQSKQHALNKAKKQQTAIYSSGWKGDSFMKLIRVKCKDFDETQFLTEEQKKEVEKFKKTFNFRIDGMLPGWSANIWHGKSSFAINWSISVAHLPSASVILDFAKNPKGFLTAEGSRFKEKSFAPGQYEQAKKYILQNF